MGDQRVHRPTCFFDVQQDTIGENAWHGDGKAYWNLQKRQLSDRVLDLMVLSGLITPRELTGAKIQMSRVVKYVMQILSHKFEQIGENEKKKKDDYSSTHAKK